MEIFKYNQEFRLENGLSFPGLEIAFTTYGSPDREVIWICHALTANSDPKEWWPGFVGEGEIFDPEKHYIVCANVIGSCYGSTSPASINPLTGRAYRKSFPQVTIRDMVSAHRVLQKELGIRRIKVAAGGSMGGQQVLEWAVSDPDLFENLFLIGTNARHSPWGIAFNEAQRMALDIADIWSDENPEQVKKSLEAARAIAMMSYRSYQAFFETQMDKGAPLDNYRASSYLRYQGLKLSRRFDPMCYWVLSKAMDTHHLGRGRQSTAQALKKIKAKTLVCGISTDYLFPISEQSFIAEHIKDSLYHVINSDFGHDGFLVEYRKIGNLILEHLLK